MRRIAPRRWGSAAAVVAIVGTAGCGGSGSGPSQTTDTSSAASTTATTSVTATPQFASGSVLFRANFKDPSQGWPTGDDSIAHYYPASGEFVMAVKKPHTEIYPSPASTGLTGQQLTNYGVTAQFQTGIDTSGSQDWYGVTCHQSGSDFYLFRLSGPPEGDTQQWQIVKHTANSVDTLAEGNARIGGISWQIAGACVQDPQGAEDLGINVNGQTLGTATDSNNPYLQGTAGVYLDGAYSVSSVSVTSFTMFTASLQ